MMNITEADTFSSTVGAPDEGDLITAWSALAGEGPVGPGLQALTNRSRYFRERAGAWGRPAEFACLDGAQLLVRGLSGLGGVLTNAGSLFLTPALAANTWYYVYAYSNAGVLDLEASTTAPDGALQYKTGDTTRRYVGCYRTNAVPAIVTFWAHNGHYTYEERQLIAGALVANAWTGPVSMASRIPPHVHSARLHLTIQTGVNAASIQVSRVVAGAPFKEARSLANGDVRHDVQVVTGATQEIYYQISGLLGTGSISVDGFNE